MRKLICIIIAVFFAGCAVGQKMSAVEGMPSGAPIERIQIKGDKCTWSPSVVKVKRGTHVIIDVESVDWDYNFHLSGYGLHFPVKKGGTVTAEFYASEKGEHEFGCYIEKGWRWSWGGMIGKLIVE